MFQLCVCTLFQNGDANFNLERLLKALLAFMVNYTFYFGFNLISWSRKTIYVKGYMDMLYIAIQKISKTVNLWAFISMYHSFSSVFMTNNMPSGVKSIAK